MNEILKKADKEIYSAIIGESNRQKDGLELIASENYVSAAVLEAMGSILTNKYSEGLPGKRYYGGNEYIDQVEELAINRAKKLFNAQQVNVQPYSGSPANLAVYLALLQPGDSVLGMSLTAGGHLTHGYKVSISGRWFNSSSYGVNDDGYIDYDNVLAVSCFFTMQTVLAQTITPKATQVSKNKQIRRICETLKMCG